MSDDVLTAAARRDAEATLRRHMGAGYDNLSYAEQQPLIATTLRNRNAAAGNVQSTPPIEPGPFVPIVRLPGPDADEQQLRDVLRAANAEYQAAFAALVQARALHEDATERRKECEAKLAGYADLDQQVTNADVDGLRIGKAGNVSYALEQALRQRDAARDRVKRAARAEHVVQTEHVAAEQRLYVARSKRELAVDAVRVFEAWQIVREIDYAERVGHRLRCALASLQLGGRDLPSALTSRIYAPLQPVRPYAAAKQEWQQFQAALRTDADAEATNIGTTTDAALVKPAQPDTPDADAAVKH